MDTVGFEQPLGVDTNIVLLNRVRQGDVLRLGTDSEAFQLVVTSVIHELDAMACPEMITTVKAAGLRRKADAEGRCFGAESILYEVEIRGSCQINGLPPAETHEEPFARTIAQGVAGRLVLGHCVFMLDSTGGGPSLLTGPLTSLNWYTVPTE